MPPFFGLWASLSKVSRSEGSACTTRIASGPALNNLLGQVFEVDDKVVERNRSESRVGMDNDILWNGVGQSNVVCGVMPSNLINAEPRRASAVRLG